MTDPNQNQNHNRAVLSCNLAYDDYKAGLGWARIAERYQTTPRIIERACKEYAQRSNRIWPPRPAKVYKRLRHSAFKPEKPQGFNVKRQYAFVILKLRHIYDHYSTGVRCAFLAQKYKVPNTWLAKTLKAYAKRNGLAYPIPRLSKP